MATKEEISNYFQELNISVDESVLNKCLEMCLNYNIGAEDFCDQWYAFTASKLNGSNPTIEHLENMERKEFQKNKDSIPKQRINTPKHSVKASEELEAHSLLSSYSSTTPKRKHVEKNSWNGQHSTITEARNISMGLNNSSPSTSLSEKYTQRSDSRSVQSFYGVPTAQYHRQSDISVSINYLNDGHILTNDARYMYEILRKKGNIIDNVTQCLGEQILKNNALILSEGILKAQLGEMTTYGRIVSDSDGRLNAQSVLLEGTKKTNCNNVTALNLSKASRYSLFPGQVVAVRGNNVSANNFVVDKVYDEVKLAFPNKVPVTKEQMQIVVGAGPFTLQDNLSYEPLHDLLTYVIEHKPHILILIGPFIDEDHRSIHNGSLAQTFDSFFEGLVENVMNTLQNVDVQVVMVASRRDAHHHPIYPTPPYSTKEKYTNLHFAPDPCLIDVEGLIIGATSADILFDISNFELHHDKGSSFPVDRMTRLTTHILNQQCFYPLYPPPKGMRIDYEMMEQFAILDQKPHILVLPSNLKNFVKNVQECLVINPERLTKGHVAGTYTRIEINPGSSTSICDRVSCQVLRI